MRTKNQFIDHLAKMGADMELVAEAVEDYNWDGIVEAADLIIAEMPGIGFLSRDQRMSTFIAVCRQLDSLVETGNLPDIGSTQIVIVILRFTSKRFRKASSMFDLNANRLNVEQRSRLPMSAREYMAATQIYGW